MEESILQIIPKALEYYDKHIEKYKHIFNKIKDPKNQIKIMDAAEDMERKIIIFLDENGKEIMRSKFELVGIYDNTHNLWVWAWAMPDKPKNLTYISRKVLNYGLDLDPTHFKMLKFELITSRFKISDILQLDIHVALSAYLTKNPVYPHKVIYGTNKNEYTIQYLFLTS